jgi:endonuclease/exonuclease/phosphatase family metal-dependent hydrolase
MVRVRVMTYNIYLGGRRGRALHEVVRGVGPDVVLVNECPKKPLVWKVQCQRLADGWGMRFAGGGRPAGSNMITVSPHVSVESVRTEILQQPLFQPRRGVVSAQLLIRGRRLGVVSCHLGLQREQRALDVERVVEAANRLRGPVVLGGDLNELPGGPSWTRLREAGFVDDGSDAWMTFPSHFPKKRIDALLARGPVTVRHHGDPDQPHRALAVASDHLPVLAVVELTGAARSVR